MFNPTDGYEATNRLLDSGVEFTAILCANDMNAVGAMKSLREHRLKVPQDVSIIGINDMETVCYLDPMLTTIHVPLEEMGHLGVKLLIDRIEGRTYIINKSGRSVYADSTGVLRSGQKTLLMEEDRPWRSIAQAALYGSKEAAINSICLLIVQIASLL